MVIYRHQRASNCNSSICQCELVFWLMHSLVSIKQGNNCCCWNSEIIKTSRTRLWIALNSPKATWWVPQIQASGLPPGEKPSLKLCAQHTDIAAYANITYVNSIVCAERMRDKTIYIVWIILQIIPLNALTLHTSSYLKMWVSPPDECDSSV